MSSHLPSTTISCRRMSLRGVLIFGTPLQKEDYTTWHGDYADHAYTKVPHSSRTRVTNRVHHLYSHIRNGRDAKLALKMQRIHVVKPGSGSRSWYANRALRSQMRHGYEVEEHNVQHDIGWIYERRVMRYTAAAGERTGRSIPFSNPRGPSFTGSRSRGTRLCCTCLYLCSSCTSIGGFHVSWWMDKIGASHETIDCGIAVSQLDTACTQYLADKK